MTKRFGRILGIMLVLWAVLMPLAYAQNQTTVLHISTAEGKDYHRIFFTGTDAIAFKTVLRNDLLSIRFDRAVELDLVVLQEHFSGVLTQASMTPDNRQLLLRLSSDHFRIRNFTSDSAFGIDLVTSDRPAGLQTLMSVPFGEKQTVVAEKSPAPDTTSPPENTEEAVTEYTKPVLQNAPGLALKPEFSERMHRRKDLEEFRDLTVEPQFSSQNGRYTLSFNWGTRIAASIFKRGEDYLWVVFDEYAVIPEEALKKALAPNIITFEGRVAGQRSTILRFRSDKFTNIRAYRDGRSWYVTFGEAGPIPNAPADLIPSYDAEDPTRINLPLKKTGRIIKLTDPMVGDELMIIPLYESYHVEEDHNFTGMAMLATAQGVSIQLIADGIRYERSEDNASLQLVNPTKHSHDGVAAPVLALPYNEPAIYPPMPNPAERSEETEPVEVADTTSMFDFTGWLHGTPYNFVPAKQELLQSIVFATDKDEQNIYRLELARFYFAQGLYREAIASIDAIEESQGAPIDNPAILMLEGASQYLDGRYAEALALFNQIKPETFEKEINRQEFDFWKQATILQLGQKGANFSYAIYQGSFPLTYPEEIRDDFALLSVEDRIVQEDYETATAILDNLKIADKPNLPVSITNREKYLQGLIALHNDDYDYALDLWKQVSEDVYDRYNRARASFALTKLLYQLDEIDLETATKKFDDLRAVWRGDGIELELLSLVGGIYINDGQYLEGLRTLREALTYYPGSDAALFITGQMSRTFIDLFNNNKAREASMEPLKALALYYEFRELTPIGTPGDTMIQSLAEWLVDADLLDRAAALLTHQMKYRVRGEERSRVAARLAEIHLMNRNYKLALEAISTTYRVEDPLLLKQRRLFLEARINIELGDYERALYVVRNHPHPTAIQLRALAYWYQNDWEHVASELDPFFAAKAKSATPLTQPETQSLLLLAMAHSFLQQPAPLLDLQDNFASRIVDDEQKHLELFNFIVSSSQPVDHRAFEETLQTDMLRTFMDGYEITSEMPNPEEQAATGGA
jgi:predicted negative regulator of RcsB-dependent stress response